MGPLHTSPTARSGLNQSSDLLESVPPSSHSRPQSTQVSPDFAGRPTCFSTSREGQVTPRCSVGIAPRYGAFLHIACVQYSCSSWQVLWCDVSPKTEVAGDSLRTPPPPPPSLPLLLHHGELPSWAVSRTISSIGCAAPHASLAPPAICFCSQTHPLNLV